MDAIVYTSNAGHTESYARMLAGASGLPVFPLAEANKHVKSGGEIIYLGWLMAGRVQGYKKAAGRYRVRAVCAVGMAPDNSQEADVRRQNNTGATPLFILQGGFDMSKLRGVYKLMMKTMSALVGKKLEQKADKTAAEQDMLDLMKNGGNRVGRQRLEPVLRWLETV